MVRTPRTEVTEGSTDVLTPVRRVGERDCDWETRSVWLEKWWVDGGLGRVYISQTTDGPGRDPYVGEFLEHLTGEQG